jgi:RNA polymerase sigma-70 factor (ECF subfamily)
MRLYLALGEAAPESVRHFYNLAAMQIRRELLDLAKHHFGPEGLGTRHDTDSGNKRQREPAVGDEPATLDEWTEFHRQVEALPDDEREVFNLLWYEELGQDEAAAVLGLSPRTLRRRWKAAKVRLYDALRTRTHGDE